MKMLVFSAMFCCVACTVNDESPTVMPRSAPAMRRRSKSGRIGVPRMTKASSGSLFTCAVCMTTVRHPEHNLTRYPKAAIMAAFFMRSAGPERAIPVR